MVKAILPIVIGVLYFATIYFLVEMWIVSRARLSDYRGKIIDLVWVCTSAVSLLFLLINARDATLRSRIDHQELASLEIKRVFGQKAGSVDNDCRNGNWPPRSVVAEGQSQSRVSEDCEGVRGLIKVAAKLYFENEQLWQGQIDLAKYHEFEEAYDRVFVSGYPKVIIDYFTPPRPNDTLTDEAMKELRGLAKGILEKKEDAAEADQELAVLHIISEIGFLWPFGFATALAFRLAKARADMIAARSKLETH